jgi:hypothetical protein
MPISLENIVLQREVDPKTGFVITKRVSKTTGQEVGLTPTYHLQKQGAGLSHRRASP